MYSYYSFDLFCFVFFFFFFFFQAEDGIRDTSVTGVQTCALPICDRFGIADVENDRSINSLQINSDGSDF